MLLHNFIFVIDAVKQSTDSEKQTFTLHVFAYICLQLRQIVYCLQSGQYQTAKHSSAKAILFESV